MSLFCPTCANILLVETGATGLRYYCACCPYVSEITKEAGRYVPIRRKEVDDVLGGAEAWENVDKTEVECPSCSHGQAYFMQIQIRSADEPTTIFYRCCSCAHRWRVD
jgi:DNA-directed RNA polymerase III subunit RPC11